MNFVILILTGGCLFQISTCHEVTAQKTLNYQPRIAQHLGLDGLGRYTYGYITPTSTKSELKGADGIIRGGYSYLDPKGKLQTIEYVADPVHGFLVAASNLPKDVPSVAYAKQRHLAQYEAIKAEHAALAVSKYNPHAAVILANPVTDLPAVVRARAQHLAAFEEVRARDLSLLAAKAASDASSYVPVISIDNLIPFSYGYIQPASTDGKYKADGRGYSYLDNDGTYKTLNYITN